MENQDFNQDEENIVDNSSDLSLDEAFSNEFKRACKLYNFRRPDKFSKEHLKALQDIHRDFVRHLATILTGYLRMEVEIDVISVDQLTYEEYICSMPSHVQNMIFKLNPLSGEVSMGMSPEILAVVKELKIRGKNICKENMIDFYNRCVDLKNCKRASEWPDFISSVFETWKNSLLH